MSDDKSQMGAISAALTQLVSDVYGDVARPSAKQVGSALETLFKLGLSPIKLLDWGYEQSKDWLVEKVRARMAQTPATYRVPPTHAVATAAVAGIAATHDAPEIRELFAELLLKAMDARTAAAVHPAYL